MWWEAGGGRWEGKGGVIDAGFVLPVPYLTNSSNTTNTTSKLPDCSCRQARFSPVSLDACLHLCSFDPLSPPLPPLLTLPLWPVRSTLKCREVERRGWVRINLKWSLHHPHASCPCRRRPPDHQDPPLLMMSRRVEKREIIFLSFLLFFIICSLFSPFFSDQNPKMTFFDQRKGPFDQKKGPNNDMFLSFFALFRSKGPFFIKRPFFRSKIFLFFNKIFSFF